MILGRSAVPSQVIPSLSSNTAGLEATPVLAFLAILISANAPEAIEPGARPVAAVDPSAIDLPETWTPDLVRPMPFSTWMMASPLHWKVAPSPVGASAQAMVIGDEAGGCCVGVPPPLLPVPEAELPLLLPVPVPPPLLPIPVPLLLPIPVPPSMPVFVVCVTGASLPPSLPPQAGSRLAAMSTAWSALGGKLESFIGGNSGGRRATGNCLANRSGML